MIGIGLSVMTMKPVGCEEVVVLGIVNFGNDKAERAKRAWEHTAEMEWKYSREIYTSGKNTMFFSDKSVFLGNEIHEDMQVKVISLDTVSAALALRGVQGAKIALLNFADFKSPGGGFIRGLNAQEEALCHESFLYNVLSKFDGSYYAYNRQDINRGLYYDRALYTPDVIFTRGDMKTKCDVITCAAPYKRFAERYHQVSIAENDKVLEERIKFVLDIAKDRGVDILILGAFGCGVFCQDPRDVAQIFKKYLDTTHKCFDLVVFAIPAGGRNFEVFNYYFSEE